MHTSHLLGVLIPAISALFSITFCVLWHKRKTLNYLLHVSLAFGLIAIGFTLKQFFLAREPLLNMFAVAACYVGAICLLISAAAARRQSKPGRKFLLSLGVLAVIGITASGASLEGLSDRSIVHNSILGALFLIGSYPLTKTLKQDMLDHILLWIFAAIGILFSLVSISIFRTPISLTPENYYDSAYWFLMNITIVLSMLAMAMTLSAMAALDLMRQIKADAEEDYLSGLLVRSAFTREVSKLTARAKTSCGAIVFDLDHFKHINDSFGHSVGDHVIQAVGQLVKKTAPSGAICGRLGGEEFGIVLPDTPLSLTYTFAERLRLAITQLVIESLPDDVSISASFGVTPHPAKQAFEKAYKNADKALYLAKQTGRNKVSQTLKEVA